MLYFQISTTFHSHSHLFSCRSNKPDRPEPVLRDMPTTSKGKLKKVDSKKKKVRMWKWSLWRRQISSQDGDSSGSPSPVTAKRLKQVWVSCSFSYFIRDNKELKHIPGVEYGAKLYLEPTRSNYSGLSVFRRVGCLLCLKASSESQNDSL